MSMTITLYKIPLMGFRDRSELCPHLISSFPNFLILCSDIFWNLKAAHIWYSLKLASVNRELLTLKILAELRMWALCIGALIIISITHWVYRWRYPRCDGKLPPGSMGWPLLGETLRFFTPNTTHDIAPFIKERMERWLKSKVRTPLVLPFLINC